MDRWFEGYLDGLEDAAATLDTLREHRREAPDAVRSVLGEATAAVRQKITEAQALPLYPEPHGVFVR